MLSHQSLLAEVLHEKTHLTIMTLDDGRLTFKPAPAESSKWLYPLNITAKSKSELLVKGRDMARIQIDTATRRNRGDIATMAFARYLVLRAQIKGSQPVFGFYSDRDLLRKVGTCLGGPLTAARLITLLDWGTSTHANTAARSFPWIRKLNTTDLSKASQAYESFLKHLHSDAMVQHEVASSFNECLDLLNKVAGSSESEMTRQFLAHMRQALNKKDYYTLISRLQFPTFYTTASKRAEIKDERLMKYLPADEYDTYQIYRVRWSKPTLAGQAEKSLKTGRAIRFTLPVVEAKFNESLPGLNKPGWSILSIHGHSFYMDKAFEMYEVETLPGYRGTFIQGADQQWTYWEDGQEVLTDVRQVQFGDKPLLTGMAVDGGQVRNDNGQLLMEKLSAIEPVAPELELILFAENDQWFFYQPSAEMQRSTLTGKTKNDLINKALEALKKDFDAAILGDRGDLAAVTLARRIHLSNAVSKAETSAFQSARDAKDIHRLAGCTGGTLAIASLVNHMDWAGTAAASEMLRTLSWTGYYDRPSLKNASDDYIQLLSMIPSLPGNLEAMAKQYSVIGSHLSILPCNTNNRYADAKAIMARMRTSMNDDQLFQFTLAVKAPASLGYSGLNKWMALTMTKRDMEMIQKRSSELVAAIDKARAKSKSASQTNLKAQLGAAPEWTISHDYYRKLAGKYTWVGKALKLDIRSSLASKSLARIIPVTGGVISILDTTPKPKLGSDLKTMRAYYEMLRSGKNIQSEFHPAPAYERYIGENILPYYVNFGTEKTEHDTVARIMEAITGKSARLPRHEELNTLLKLKLSIERLNRNVKMSQMPIVASQFESQLPPAAERGNYSHITLATCQMLRSKPAAATKTLQSIQAADWFHPATGTRTYNKLKRYVGRYTAEQIWLETQKKKTNKIQTAASRFPTLEGLNRLKKIEEARQRKRIEEIKARYQHRYTPPKPSWTTSPSTYTPSPRPRTGSTSDHYRWQREIRATEFRRQQMADRHRWANYLRRPH